MNCTFCWVRFSNSTPLTFAAAFWLTKLILPGFAFIHVTSSARLLAARSFFATMSCGLLEIRPIGSKSFFEIVIEFVDDAADVGVPLADIEGVAVRRRTGDAADADAAAGAADIFDHHGLSERRPHAFRQDAGGGIGRSARRERHHQRNGPRRKVLRLRANDAGKKRDCQRDKKLSHEFPPSFET